jgi:hypothetical protein
MISPLDATLEILRSRVVPLERFIHLFGNSLTQPRLRDVLGDRGFRYENPGVRHFCLLKAVRAVSSLNASLELAKRGYLQEIATLMRTLVECTTHIEFVLEPADSEDERAEVKRYVEAFFADSRRDPEAEIKRAQVQQGKVHASLGRSLDKIAEASGEAEGRVPAAKLYSKIYRVYSNYVHAKYPETIDLYGGRPGRFHLQGMGGTPKASEGMEVIQTFIGTVENAIVRVIQGLDLRSLVQSDPILLKWYSDRFAKSTVK